MSALNVRPTLIDDLRPDSLAQLTFHPRLDRQLRRLATQCRDDLPNLLFYGPPGAGKRTRVIALLRRLLQPRVPSMNDDGSSLFERYAEHRTLFVNTQTRSATFMKAKRSKARGRPPKRSADQMLAGGDGGDDAPADDAASEDRSTTAARTAAAASAQKPSGSYNVLLSCVGSPYHIEFTPADAGRKDAQVMQACIKLFCEQANTVATLRNVFQTVSVEQVVAGTVGGSRNGDNKNNNDNDKNGSVAPQRVAGVDERQQAAALPYRVVIVNDADKLSFDAHAAMRRLMEEHVGVLRFILVAEQVTKIAPAIRSRCCQIRVPAPEQSAIVKSLQQAAALRECGGRFGGDRSLFDGFVAAMSAEERAEFFNDADDKRVLPQPTVFQLLDMAQSNVAYALTLLVFNDQQPQPQQQQQQSTTTGRGRRKKQATESMAVSRRLVDRDELQRPGWAQETRALAKAFVCGYGYVLEARDRVEKAWSDQDVGPLNYTAQMLEWSRRVAYELLSRCVPMRDFLWLLLDDLLFWINHLCFYAENDEQVRREASNRWRERAIESQPERWSGERCDLLRVRCVQLCAAFEQRIVTAFRPIVQLDALFVHLVEACEYHRAGKALPDEQCSVPQIY